MKKYLKKEKREKMEQKKEVTLEDIMECLKDQNNKINEAKNETNSKIETFMGKIELNLNEVRKDVTVLNTIMEEREREHKNKEDIFEDKIISMEKEAKGDKDEICNRLQKIEESLRRTNYGKMKSTELRQMSKENNAQPVIKEKIIPMMQGNIGEKEKQKTLGSSWSKSVEEELKEAAEMTEKVMREKMDRKRNKKTIKKKAKGMNTLKKWFSQESPETSDISSNSDSSDGENEEEIIDRKNRNKERKERNKNNKRRKKTEAATKASHTVGCKPITNKEIEKYLEMTGDIKQAREAAVKSFLKDFLQFDDSELDDIEMLETKISPKGDNTVYAVFKEINNIKEIHWRAAQIRNPAVGIRNYIPPQFWQRYMYLNEECSNYRSRFPNVKTQLRFNDKDVEILCKVRGSNEPYRTVPYEDITDPKYIPKFEYNLKWLQQNGNKPLRKKLVPFREEVNAMETEEIEKQSMTRQRSTDSKSSKTDQKKTETGCT